jgi:hypothetical protein
MAYDAASGQEVLFGGYNGRYLDDTWTFDGRSWTLQHPAESPAALDGAVMAYDAATEQLVLFGGANAAGNLSSTWIWTGTTWVDHATAPEPPARWYASLAFDSASRQLVLFGGLGKSGPLGDTWIWAGAGWTELEPRAEPAARWGASIAYDPRDDGLVLFGGGTYTGSGNLGDTWIWNGSTWTERSQPSGPQARYVASIGYDAATGEVLLYGGAVCHSCAFLGDTWSWDGEAWTRVATSVAPPPRWGATMAYDDASGEMVLFGGARSVVGNSDPQADSWVFATPGYRTATESGKVFATAGLGPGGGPAGALKGVVGIASTWGGYWLVQRDGGVFTYGDARFYGSLPQHHIVLDDVVGIAAVPEGTGYWVVTADGEVYGFGSARDLAPSPSIHVDDVVGIAAFGSAGYWLVGADGGVFAFGGARFAGACPAVGSGCRGVSDVVGAAATGPGGYLLVGRDGGVFAFGSARYRGSCPGAASGCRGASDVAGIATDLSGGYWIARGDGGVIAFGGAPSLTGGTAPPGPTAIVTIAAAA